MPTLQEQLKKNPKMGQIKLKNMLRKGKLKGTYTVKKGDSWFDIAGRVFSPLYDGDWKLAQTHAGELAKANPHIANLRPGQQIKLPYRQAGYTVSRGRGAYVPRSMLSGGVPSGGPEASNAGNYLDALKNSQEQQQAAKLGGPGAMAMDQGGGGGGRPPSQGNRGRPGPGPKPPGWKPPKAKHPTVPPKDTRTTSERLKDAVAQRKKGRGLNRGEEYGMGVYSDPTGRYTVQTPYTAAEQMKQDQKDDLSNWWSRQVQGLQNINDAGLKYVQDAKDNVADLWDKGVQNYQDQVKNQRDAARAQEMYRKHGMLAPIDPWSQPMTMQDAKQNLVALGKNINLPFEHRINQYLNEQKKHELLAQDPSYRGAGYRRVIMQRQAMDAGQGPYNPNPPAPHRQPTKNYGPVSDRSDAGVLGSGFDDLTSYAHIAGDATIEPCGIEGYLVKEGRRPLYWTPLAIEQNKVDVSLLPGLGYELDIASGVWVAKPSLGVKTTGTKPNYSNPYYRPGAGFRRRGRGGGGGGGGRGAQPRYSRSERSGGTGYGRSNPYRGGGVSWRIS